MPFRSFFVSICKRKGFYYKSTDPVHMPLGRCLYLSYGIRIKISGGSKKCITTVFRHFTFHFAAFVVRIKHSANRTAAVCLFGLCHRMDMCSSSIFVRYSV